MRCSIVLTLVLLLAWQPMSSGSVYACSTPVFRYALERWPADIYVVTIYQRGPLTPREQSVVDWLQTGFASSCPSGRFAALILQ